MSQWVQMILLCLQCLIPAIFSMPSTKPNFLVSPSSILYSNSSLLNATYRGDDEPDIFCLRKPRMYHIDIEVCRSVLNKLLTAPDARNEKTYHRSTTRLSAGPCHVELRKSHGNIAISLKPEEIGLAVGAILQQCEKYQGAGWGQMMPDFPWYVLAYGSLRSREGGTRKTPNY